MEKSLFPFSFKKKSKGSTYIVDAEKVADIVSTGIASGDYSGINQKLDDLSAPSPCRVRYVFERPSYTFSIFMIVLSSVFTLGLMYIAFIGIATALFSEAFRINALIAVAISSIGILVNALLIGKSCKRIGFYSRYSVYYKMLRFRNIEIIEDLSVYAKQNKRRVIKDLKKAIKLKLIPQGHFGRDNMFIVLSDEIYDDYQSKKAAYERYYRKQLEERARMKERTKEMAQIMELGNEYIGKIQDSIALIKDKSLVAKLRRMEDLVSMIFHEVDINPKQTRNLGLFINYYLPTAEKLLTAYLDLDEKPIQGHSTESAKKQIRDSIEKLNVAFEGILERFYQEKEMDISSDISAMEIIMQQEGLLESKE